MSLVLFDIDGTLLLSGGAGIRAMTRAFAQVFGVADAFANSDVAGRTDTYLLSSALRQWGLPDTPEQHTRIREAYVSILQEELSSPPRGPFGLMPGIAALLDELEQHEAVHLALLTGNFERAAYVKLAHFGIDRFFPWGAFGEESADRNDVARVARRRAEELALPAAAREHTIVIGDTPHDITCARAINARVIAVATGNYGEEALRQAGADHTLKDLSDTAFVLDAILRRRETRCPFSA